VTRSTLLYGVEPDGTPAPPPNHPAVGVEGGPNAISNPPLNVIPAVIVTGIIYLSLIYLSNIIY
jgi:hypothetical protein